MQYLTLTGNGRSKEENELLDLVSFDRQYTGNQLKNDVKRGNLKIFDYESIMGVTNRFSPENMVGKGGFGPVYKVVPCNHLFEHFSGD